MGTNTALTILAVVVVVAVVALAVWAFVLAPIIVPLRHGRHHPQH
jgi:HAMP domain-containing protein